MTLDHHGNDPHSQVNAQFPLDRTTENSFSTTIDLGGEFAVSPASSVVVLDTGATANLVCKSWLANHNLFLERRGMGKVRLYPSAARFKFGDGKIGEVRFAANIVVGIAGCKGTFTAFVTDAEIPALLCKGALEALGAQLDFANDTMWLGRHGICVPLGLNAMGHYVMSEAEFDTGRPKRTRDPSFPASYFEWSLMDKRPDLSDGGLHLPLKESGLLRFATPKKFVACTAATHREAQDEGAADPKEIIMKLHAK